MILLVEDRTTDTVVVPTQVFKVGERFSAPTTTIKREQHMLYSGDAITAVDVSMSGAKNTAMFTAVPTEARSTACCLRL